ncbi:MAG TPA: hypothetical protein VJT72_06550 [Pseudonocardiaceae bacterium]|nr:hypothetical protein [Pseudonocardiaceae bacterium]
MTDVDQAKQTIRERVWSLLEREHAAPPGVHGRIPSFYGADHAADRLITLPVWHAARVIKVVPDTAQQPVRAHALREGKLVYMAVPKLADRLPFYVLTTVHSLQIVDDELPEIEHDFSVAVIVTPDDVMTCSTPRRPGGSSGPILVRRRLLQFHALPARPADLPG